MDYKETDKTLTITINDDERAELQELKEESDNFQSASDMHDFLEPLTCNSELEWINPADTGDLTDAPMLGILGEEGCRDNTVFLDNYGLIVTGHDGFWILCTPIIKRWAYMNYQLRSPLEDLLENGEVVFISGESE